MLVLRHHGFRNLDDLGGGDNHSLFQAEGIDLLAVDRKFLAIGNLEGLIRSIFQREDHRVRRRDVPHLPGNGMDRRDGLGSGCNNTSTIFAQLPEFISSSLIE
jgi:hypothetical protein